jgi:hypothetical protein
MELLSPGINSDIDTLYLLKHRDGTEYIVDEIYTASEFEFFAHKVRFDGTQDRYVAHLLWYRHGTLDEWVDAECRCTGFVGADIVAVNTLVPIGGDTKVVNTPRGLHRLS